MLPTALTRFPQVDAVFGDDDGKETEAVRIMLKKIDSQPDLRRTDKDGKEALSDRPFLLEKPGGNCFLACFLLSQKHAETRQ